jgi:hypothetical protein
MGSGSLTFAQQSKRTITLSSSLPTQAWGAKTAIPSFCRVPLRVVPRFQTTHPTYQWLNRLQCVNIGEADLERFEVRYDVYAIR